MLNVSKKIKRYFKRMLFSIVVAVVSFVGVLLFGRDFIPNNAAVTVSVLVAGMWLARSLTRPTNDPMLKNVLTIAPKYSSLFYSLRISFTILEAFIVYGSVSLGFFYAGLLVSSDMLALYIIVAAVFSYVFFSVLLLFLVLIAALFLMYYYPSIYKEVTPLLRKENRK